MGDEPAKPADGKFGVWGLEFGMSCSATRFDLLQCDVPHHPPFKKCVLKKVGVVGAHLFGKLNFDVKVHPAFVYFSSPPPPTARSANHPKVFLFDVFSQISHLILEAQV